VPIKRLVLHRCDTNLWLHYRGFRPMLDRRVRDWTTDRRAAPVQLTYRSLWLSFALFTVIAILIWLLIFELSKSLPFVQNGAALVGQDKWAIAQSTNMFKSTERVRLVAFGNSKTLAGFRPLVFDPPVSPDAGAYNLSIPGDDKFVDLLETALSHGNVPTHVFLQSLPQSWKDESFWGALVDNKKLVNLLFPFRSFVRDAVIFAYESHNSGGVLAQYRKNAKQVQQIRDERGYYFIKSQSHYSGDQLPDGYALPTDRPNETMKRVIDPSAPQFSRLMQLAERYDFQVLLVPVAFRRGEFDAPPAVDNEAVRQLSPFPRAHVIGPAYWIYEAQYFSDPVHLNIQGADRYSKQLAALFKSWLSSGL
jgi:hypothetical protein